MTSGKSTKLQKTTLDSQGTAASSDGDAVSVALTVLYHPDLSRVGDRAIVDDLSERGAAFLSRTEPAFAPPRQAAGEPLNDEHLSRKPLKLVAEVGGGVRLEIGESGTAVVVRGQRVRGGATFSAEQLRRGVVLELGHRIVLLLHHVTMLEEILRAADTHRAESALVGESEGLRRLLVEIRNVANFEHPTLLRGETGSGKELVARAIHDASPRRERPFVAVNMGAIQSSLAVAELFGAEKGAYTGSIKRQVGYFEQAQGGTLFLDEIGDAPLELQVALLRALETGEVQPVGAQQARKADVRIIAATDADLEAKIAAGAFRAPLLNRITAYEVWIPPLRQRRDDIGRLFARFLREELEKLGEASLLDRSSAPWVPSALVARLMDHDWPGNVRQLRNVARQLVVGSRGLDHAEVTPAVERLLTEPLGALRERPLTAASAPPPAPPANRTASDPSPARGVPREGSDMPSRDASRARAPAARKPADVTEEELGEALRENRWDFAATAQQLGVSRASIYLLIERYPRFRAAGDLTTEEITRSYQEHKGDVAQMASALEVSERALRRRVRELGIE